MSFLNGSADQATTQKVMHAIDRYFAHEQVDQLLIKAMTLQKMTTLEFDDYSKLSKYLLALEMKSMHILICTYVDMCACDSKFQMTYFVLTYLLF